MSLTKDQLTECFHKAKRQAEAEAELSFWPGQDSYKHAYITHRMLALYHAMVTPPRQSLEDRISRLEDMLPD